MTHQCVRCGATTDATVCRPEALSLAESLRTAAGHAEDAWTVIARQARMGATGGAPKTDAVPPPPAEDLRRNRVKDFGWQASIERPVAGALRPEPTLAALGALDRYRAAENTIGTWARDLGSDATGLAAACTWLAERAEQLRQHRAADEAFTDLERACRSLERLVDRPPDGHRLVGMCDCGKILYAPHGRDVVKCKPCGAKWNVTESQEILLGHLDGQLVTVPEALDMAGWLDTDRTREQIRKLVTKWADRGHVLAHGHAIDDDGVVRPTYRFGEIRARLAETPRRRREGAAA